MYGVEEIMKITGYERTKAYRVIHMLQDQMKKDNEKVIIIGSKVPISYFKKYILLENIEGGDESEKRI